jgi:hypothetical protein
MLGLLLLFSSVLTLCQSSTMKKPHGHQGVLESYDGSIIPMNVTPEQESKLDKGDYVSFNERVGKSGRGVVIQDVEATPTVCMSKIRDLANYATMVQL